MHRDAAQRLPTPPQAEPSPPVPQREVLRPHLDDDPNDDHAPDSARLAHVAWLGYN